MVNIEETFDTSQLEEEPKEIQTECLYRMIGQCKNCLPDYDKTHHPNNYDCPRFHPIGLMNIKTLPDIIEEIEYARFKKL